MKEREEKVYTFDCNNSNLGMVQ